MSVAIVPCKCSNDFQDRVYGRGARVANDTQKSKSPDKVTVRCTVCKAEHEVNKGQLKK